MIYVLLLFLIAIDILFFILFDRNILSPSVIGTSMFVVSTLFAVANVNNWKFTISPLTVLVISLSLLFLGEVVTKNVEPYAIVGGNSARLIKCRCGESLRRRLCGTDVAALFDSFKKDGMPLVYADLTEDVLNKILEEHNG